LHPTQQQGGRGGRWLAVRSARHIAVLAACPLCVAMYACLHACGCFSVVPALHCGSSACAARPPPHIHVRWALHPSNVPLQKRLMCTPSAAAVCVGCVPDCSVRASQSPGCSRECGLGPSAVRYVVSTARVPPCSCIIAFASVHSQHPPMYCTLDMPFCG
jgi:hypothetical protein